jgi:hypothetical protein
MLSSKFFGISPLYCGLLRINLSTSVYSIYDGFFGLSISEILERALRVPNQGQFSRHVSAEFSRCYSGSEASRIRTHQNHTQVFGFQAYLHSNVQVFRAVLLRLRLPLSALALVTKHSMDKQAL